MTPSTTFPAQPPAVEVPEMREAVSSKTSCFGRPRAWELKPRPKLRVARRQCGWVRGLSFPCCQPSPTMPAQRPHCCLLQARAEALCFPQALDPRGSSFNRSSGSSGHLELAQQPGFPLHAPALPVPPKKPSSHSAPMPSSSLTFWLVIPQ